MIDELEVEMASFCDVMATTYIFYNSLPVGYLFSLRKKLDYNKVMAWVCFRLSFSLI